MSKQILRREGLEEVYGCIQAGESAQIIGVSGVGKSNHFNNVLDVENVQAHFKGRAKRPILVRVNFHYAVDFSPRTVYSLMLEPLEMLGDDPDSKEISAQIIDLHSELLDVGDDMLKVQRIFRRAIRLVMKDPDQSLFFVFDQFEKMFQNAPARLFANFRGLREEFKYRLGFIIFAQRPLTQLITDPDPDHEEFLELFQGKKIGLKPYNKDDAQLGLDRITERNAFELEDNAFPSLYELSGGHGGLLRALLFSLCEDGWNLNDDFQNSQKVQNECRKIWESLHYSEQLWLNSRLKEKAISPQEAELVSAAGENLSLKGLVYHDESVFSTLFCGYVSKKKDYKFPLEYDSATKSISIYGEPLEMRITPRESEIFEFLFERAGEVVTGEEIAQKVWGASDSFALQTLRSNMSRLRKKVQAGGDQYRFIANAPNGSGYILLIH